MKEDALGNPGPLSDLNRGRCFEPYLGEQLSGSTLADATLAVAGPLPNWRRLRQRWSLALQVPTGDEDGPFGSGGWDVGVRWHGHARAGKVRLGAELGWARLDRSGHWLGLPRNDTWSAVLDVTGEDMGVLIGRRGGTMASLQYLVNLMVSRKYRGEAPFSVDVEGYRRRREESLEDLAHRSAESVRDNGRPITLEAMPAYERRIVHLTLSKDPTVGTASVGEGEHRKVRISVRR